MEEFPPDPYHPTGEFALYIPGLGPLVSERANRGVRAPNRANSGRAAGGNAEAYNRVLREEEERVAAAPGAPMPKVKSRAQRYLEAAARQTKMDPYRPDLERAKVAAQPKAAALAKAVVAGTQRLYADAAATAPPCLCGCGVAERTGEREVQVITRQAAFTIPVALFQCSVCRSTLHAGAADLGCVPTTPGAADRSQAAAAQTPRWRADGLMSLCDKLTYGRSHTSVHALTLALYEVFAEDESSETPGKSQLKKHLNDAATVRFKRAGGECVGGVGGRVGGQGVGVEGPLLGPLVSELGEAYSWYVGVDPVQRRHPELRQADGRRG